MRTIFCRFPPDYLMVPPEQPIDVSNLSDDLSAFAADISAMRSVLEAATPAAPPRSLPTVEAIAKAICCPDGCEFESGLTFLANCCADGCEDEAAAVLALFAKPT